MHFPETYNFGHSQLWLQALDMIYEMCPQAVNLRRQPSLNPPSQDCNHITQKYENHEEMIKRFDYEEKVTTILNLIQDF